MCNLTKACLIIGAFCCILASSQAFPTKLRNDDRGNKANTDDFDFDVTHLDDGLDDEEQEELSRLEREQSNKDGISEQEAQILSVDRVKLSRNDYEKKQSPQSQSSLHDLYSFNRGLIYDAEV